MKLLESEMRERAACMTISDRILEHKKISIELETQAITQKDFKSVHMSPTKMFTSFPD